MNSSQKRSELARIAYDSYEDKSKIEKYLKVCGETFEMCLTDMPEHHQTINRNRGFLRTYHKPFWTENPKGCGRTYHLGVIYIINEDNEKNKTYELTNPTSKDLNYHVGTLGHRIIEIDYDVVGEVIATLTPQRWNFDD